MGLPPLLTPLNLPPVSSLARYFFTTPRSLIAPGALWKIAGITLAGALAIVVRACGYDLGALLAYSAYFAAFVALPGVVLLWALNRRALSIATVFALALPTGFAIEILSYLGLASVGAREVYRFMPLLWLAIQLHTPLPCSLPWRIGAPSSLAAI